MSGLRFPKPGARSDEADGLGSRVERRLKKRASAEERWRTVCRQVDARDNYRCRACGAQCNPGSVDLLDRGHRHHLAYRSKGGQDVASNVITLCARCHDHEHRHLLRLEPATPHGADGPVEVWRMRDGQEFLTRRETAVHRVEKD